MSKAWVYVNLWDIIRDFFVVHVFGGVTSSGVQYHTNIGSMATPSGGILSDTQSFYVPITGYNLFNVSQVGYISLGDWLSTTSTIITLVVILICIAFFIRWIFKVCSNAILLR